VHRRRILILLAASVLPAIGVVAFWPGEREPEYNGKKLSEWLREYRQPVGAMAPTISQEAPDAVRHIGTNALPFLVKWIRDDRDMPRWRAKLFHIAYTWNLQSSARKKALEFIAQRQLLAYRATWAFQILGQSATPAIPELTRVARDGNESSAFQALTALASVAKQSFLPLLAFANDRNYKWRIQAISALGDTARTGADAHTVVVSLTEYLKDPDPTIVYATANVLGRLNLESEISVPALAELMQSTDAGARERGIANLRCFGARSRSALPDLLAALRGSNAGVRKSATNALQTIAPDVLTNAIKDF
jgi:hypothetical protein